LFSIIDRQVIPLKLEAFRLRTYSNRLEFDMLFFWIDCSTF